jgi:DNA replication initiation complex subunit (GINS family)
MGNVEIEIYMTNFVGFFKKNPDQLKMLIGDFDGETFYEKVRSLAIKNQEEEKEVAPTRQQMIELLVSMNKERELSDIKKVVKPFMEHHMGKINLN